MSGGVTGPGSGAGRIEYEPADPAKTDALVNELKQIQGSGPAWLGWVADGDSSLKELAQKLLADGKIDASDAKKLVRDAKDYGRVTDKEKQVFANMLREYPEKFAPEAREALSRYFNVPIGRPTIPSDFPGQMKVKEGPSDYSLDDDTLTMTGSGKFESTIKRDIYTAGYLPRTEGPLNRALGTKPPERSLLSDADNAINKDKSPVERFDEAMKRGTGAAGGLKAKYAIDGKDAPPEGTWWGFCDRWSYNALDPEIATRVNKPIMYKGVEFSTAELRGISTYLGRADENGGLFDKDVSAIDLQKASALFLKENGPGFIADVWNDKAKGSSQVWNQPFDGVKQDVKELKGAELDKVLKDQFKLSGGSAAGKRAFYVETEGVYGIEAGDEHEGAATHTSKTWKSWIVTDASGKAIDGKYAPGSADPLEYIWRPNRTGKVTGEAKFLRDMLKAGVPQERVTAFESAIKALPAGQRIGDAQKQVLKAQFKGVSGAFADAALNAKLAPYGLTAADFN